MENEKKIRRLIRESLNKAFLTSDDAEEIPLIEDPENNINNIIDSDLADTDLLKK